MTDDMASSVPLASKTAKFHYRTRLSQDHISDIKLKMAPRQVRDNQNRDHPCATTSEICQG